MRILLSLTVVFCVLAGTACSQTQAVPASIVLVDQAGYGHEMRTRHNEFHWPPDHRPDLDRLVAATQPSPGDKVQAGLSHTILTIVNSCAWYLSWDAARSRKDHAASAEALRVMTDVLTTFPQPEDQAGKEFAEQIAAQARSGDPFLALEYVAANCAETPWATGWHPWS